MEGENLKFELDKRNDGIKGLKQINHLLGKLQKVGQNTVVIIEAANGNIREIPKNIILSIEKAKSKTSKKNIDVWGVGALGWFVGFGIGSYIQGDVKGGTAGLVWDLLNGVSFGLIFGIGPAIDSGGGIFVIGIVIVSTSLLISRIFQAVHPHLWYKKNLAFLKGLYLVPEIAYDGRVGIKGGLIYNRKF